MEHYKLLSDKTGVGGVRLPANSLLPENCIMKAWEYGMVAYFQ